MGQERSHEEDKEIGVNSKGKDAGGNVAGRYPRETGDMSLLRPSNRH